MNPTECPIKGFSKDYRVSPFHYEWSPYKEFFFRCYVRNGDCTGNVRGDLQPREMTAKLKGRIEAAH